tara:strand:- start:61 stop:429 length:369 start_codon:yes stop_codon:yes gene_type:complete
MSYVIVRSRDSEGWTKGWSPLWLKAPTEQEKADAERRLYLLERGEHFGGHFVDMICWNEMMEVCRLRWDEYNKDEKIKDKPEEKFDFDGFGNDDCDFIISNKYAPEKGSWNLKELIVNHLWE